MFVEQLALPAERFRLEEINLPEYLVDSLVGKSVAVEVIPEVKPLTRSFPRENLPNRVPLIANKQDGTIWNDYWPLQVVLPGCSGPKLALSTPLADCWRREG